MTEAPALLAFETVARSGSACVIAADGAELAFVDLAGVESERALVPLVDSLIRTHGLPRELAVACGPGSFTGLRVGVVCARTLAWVEGLRVRAVDSLSALAMAQGDGLWWTLLPLKRDTTFHALFRVAGGSCETLRATAAGADAEAVELHPLTSAAIAIGPALATKPDLAGRWCPGVRLGSSAGVDARGVGRAAAGSPLVAWNELLPAYHQLSAPELQRRSR
jgi:tRNA threonylcarbamoyladenosine biosynthesis protein TsaB